jgi:hypothetical protein
MRLLKLTSYSLAAERFFFRCKADFVNFNALSPVESPSTMASNSTTMHCNENPIHVSQEKKLRGLSPNFHLHVSVRDLYIPRIGPHIFLE